MLEDHQQIQNLELLNSIDRFLGSTLYSLGTTDPRLSFWEQELKPQLNYVLLHKLPKGKDTFAVNASATDYGISFNVSSLKNHQAAVSLILNGLLVYYASLPKNSSERAKFKSLVVSLMNSLPDKFDFEG